MTKEINVICQYCGKFFTREKLKDPLMEEMAEAVDSFCSDKCVLAELERQSRATDRFEDLDSDATGYKGTVQ